MLQYQGRMAILAVRAWFPGEKIIALWRKNLSERQGDIFVVVAITILCVAEVKQPKPHLMMIS
jgi:hypothetical protein